MLKKFTHKTYFTKQVYTLLTNIYGRSSLQDSVLDRATCYFEQQKFLPTEDVDDSPEYKQYRMECQTRHQHLLDICQDILNMSEGKTFTETKRKSAQFLGTIQLLSPTEGNKVASNNEQCKALYKAILCLRLVDQLFLEGKVSDLYMLSFLAGISKEQFEHLPTTHSDIYQRYREQIKIPLLMAALLQDIGQYHPDAQEILLGKDGLSNPFRTLENDDRKRLLQISYQQTLRYFSKGLGKLSYTGDCREERDQFDLDEQNKQIFIRSLLKSSVNPKNSIGNLLKVPQIYTSIILSTKSNYNYKVLPKVYQVLYKNAERGGCAKQIVDSLYTITGMFPQGYGIVYFPLNEFGEQADCYEYAIVNHLYPKNPEEPFCRLATRKLAFVGYGQNIVISTKSNLYFAENAKKLSALNKDRLNEILTLLASDFKERQASDLLPRCWHAEEFFSVKANQKLWNNADF